MKAPEKAGTFPKELCAFRVVVVAPEDKNKAVIDPSQLIFQSFEEQSLFMTLRVTEGKLSLPTQSESAYLSQPNQAIIKDLKSEAVPNFFLLFDYP